MTGLTVVMELVVASDGVDIPDWSLGKWLTAIVFIVVVFVAARWAWRKGGGGR